MPWDVTVELVDRPGSLADMGEAAGEAGVNIDGVCGFPSEGVGVIHVLVDDPEAATAAFQSSGLTVRGQREVLVAGVANEPGVLGGLARRFAEAGINIDLVYMAADTRIVLGVDDIDAGRSLI